MIAVAVWTCWVRLRLLYKADCIVPIKLGTSARTRIEVTIDRKRVRVVINIGVPIEPAIVVDPASLVVAIAQTRTPAPLSL